MCITLSNTPPAHMRREKPSVEPSRVQFSLMQRGNKWKHQDLKPKILQKQEFTMLETKPSHQEA